MVWFRSSFVFVIGLLNQVYTTTHMQNWYQVKKRYILQSTTSEKFYLRKARSESRSVLFIIIYKPNIHTVFALSCAVLLHTSFCNENVSLHNKIQRHKSVLFTTSCKYNYIYRYVKIIIALLQHHPHHEAQVPEHLFLD